MQRSRLALTRWVALTAALTAALASLPACGAEVPPARSTASSDIFLTPDTTRVRGLIPPNATLDGMLRAHGLAAAAVADVSAAAQTVFDPRRLRSSQPFVLETTVEGLLRRFEYEIDADVFLRVMPDPSVEDTFRADVIPIPKTLEPGLVAGTIDDAAPSLFQAMEGAGESAELTIVLAAIFAGEIDFNTEVRRGDRFALAFDRFVREDGPSTYGTINAAKFYNDGRTVRAIRFAPPDGKPGYYDAEGRSLRRFFLKSPIKFGPRVTSRYSLRRRHPVLRTMRAHRGVDYGAPTGAPVIAVAAGTVVSATYDNTNGRMVRLRHASGYDSYYLHLSGFARGIRRGARVDQGQTIGRVGSTGLATGPHLHYGLRKNGAWVDPLREHRRMPPGDPVPVTAMEAFRSVRDQALAQLALASTSPQPASVDGSE